MVSTKFLLLDSLGKVGFFEKTFLLADTSIELVLKITFFSFNNTGIEFAELGILISRSYTTVKALPTTS